MVQYDIASEGAFLTFTGDDGIATSYKKALVKKLKSSTAGQYVQIITIDNDGDDYNFNQVNDPGSGSSFADLATFRAYLITELSN